MISSFSDDYALLYPPNSRKWYETQAAMDNNVENVDARLPADADSSTALISPVTLCEC